MCVLKASLCSLSGEIDDLAYISTSECRFDGQDKSVVCTVSSDGTVRAWDLHEVSCLGGARMSAVDYAVTSVLQPFAFILFNHHSQLVKCGSPIVQWKVAQSLGQVTLQA